MLHLLTIAHVNQECNLEIFFPIMQNLLTGNNCIFMKWPIYDFFIPQDIMFNSVSKNQCTCCKLPNTIRRFGNYTEEITTPKYDKLTPLCYALLYALQGTPLQDYRLYSNIPQTFVELGADPNIWGDRAPLGMVTRSIYHLIFIRHCLFSLRCFDHKIPCILHLLLFYSLFDCEQIEHGAKVNIEFPFSALHSVIRSDQAEDSILKVQD